MKKVSLKDFINELKSSFKGEYTNALWPIGGFFIIFIALSAISMYFFQSNVRHDFCRGNWDGIA